MSSNIRAPIRWAVRQTFNIQTDMELADPRVERDVKILRSLRDALRSAIKDGSWAKAAQPSQPLYCKYRTAGFPIRKRDGRRIPTWKHISPWMKIQVFLLVLSEGVHRSFTVHLHDDLRLTLEREGKDQRAYLRDRINRQLRVAFGGFVPMHFFVIEDRDKVGNQVLPHAHGSIQIPRLALEKISSETWRKSYKRLEAKHGREIAELKIAEKMILWALRSAAGLAGRRAKVSTAGVQQDRKVWVGTPTQPLLNHQWVTYMLKNEKAYSPILTENRVTRTYGILAEAKVLWAIVRG